MAYAAQPEWTERADKRGLDPLGLQTSGIALYQELLPGVSNVTLRIRPYGLYAWLTAAYAKLSEGSTDAEAWRRWVRRTEALYALTAADAGGETGVAGVEWATRRLLDVGPDDLIDFTAATETSGSGLYLQQSMGVYGGAYATQMLEMGVLGQAEDERNQIWVPTPHLGLPLATAFAESLGPEREAFMLAAISKPVVRRSDLAKLHGILPSRINPESSEASIYLSALFGQHDLTSQHDETRNKTLLLVLMLAKSLAARPSADQVRWALFNAEPGSFGDGLEATRLQWEAYHTHDLLQLAFAVLLRLSTEELRIGGTGLTFRDLVAASTARTMASLPGTDALTWSTFVSGLKVEDPAALATPLTRLRPDGIDQRVAESAISLIGIIQSRVDARPDLAEEIERVFPRTGPTVFNRSIRSELAFLRTRNDADLTTAISDLFADRIIRRHSQVAMTKFARQRDYTFLFEASDGRLKYRANYGPVLTTPRLGPAIAFLADLGLIAGTGLTARGEAWLGDRS
ncbi:hypothetical protein [Brevundimonas sp. TWP2-3-4b2]|uniref:hypothetical protein n=1 Tax=Brevundimonas sp. TWP2-3-4b2 TaxID=2804595 RepID=UPI003CF17802